MTLRQFLIASLVAPLILFWCWCAWWHAMYDGRVETATTGDDIVRDGRRLAVLREVRFTVATDGTTTWVATAPPPDWLRNAVVGVLAALLVWRVGRGWRRRLPPPPKDH